jgi:hypothetical protein
LNLDDSSGEGVQAIILQDQHETLEHNQIVDVPGFDAITAPIGNRLYRRLAIGGAVGLPTWCKVFAACADVG